MNSAVNRIQDTANDLLYNVATVVSLPVEIALRLEYGTEYFTPMQIFFATLMMLFLPVAIAILDAISQWIPFLGGGVTVGVFGIWTLSKIFFVGAAVHTARICRRIAHMELEENSWFAGPPLPIFSILPFGWWTTRIAIEPLFVLLLALTLQNLFVLQGAAAHYLMAAAVALALKESLDWFSQWQYVRHLMNLKYLGPRIARIADNTATDEDHAILNVASLSKDLPEDMRQSAAVYLAHAISPEAQN
jgi:hypothetical protein